MRLLAKFSQSLHHLLQCKPWQEGRHRVSIYENTAHLLNLILNCQAEIINVLVMYKTIAYHRFANFVKKYFVLLCSLVNKGIIFTY